MRIVGSLNSVRVAEPVACAFGRGVLDQGVLYVLTGGGVLAPIAPLRYIVWNEILAIEADTGK